VANRTIASRSGEKRTGTPFLSTHHQSSESRGSASHDLVDVNGDGVTRIGEGRFLGHFVTRRKA
jgi:hypothetical protein